ncbi:metallophosphoesterase [Halobacillus mangrovi]|uniref:metallophosphoesterase n=1 Tax=Halobacillus mangrovi TaxID=402384 RepID=UPI003D96B798
MLWLLLAVTAAALLLYLYMRYSAQNDQLEFHTIEAQSYPADKPLHIFFISDIHNRVIKKSTLSKIENVDIVIIGGDLVDKRTAMSQLKHNLEALQEWKVPLYFIPGNNDHELIGYDVIDILEEENVKVLSNGDVTIPLQGEQKIVLSGIDPYFLKPRRHMYHIKDRHPYQILCVHDPYVFKQMNKVDQQRFDLILTGHTHGGQIRVFGLGPYTRGGWFSMSSRPLLISEGYGTSLMPLRLGTRAECHLITVKKSK